jgi:hypothetical protein
MLIATPVALGLMLAALYLYLRWKYSPLIVKIFQPDAGHGRPPRDEHP